MTTRVSSEHFGEIIVSETTARLPSETGVHTLFVEDKKTGGRLWFQRSFRDVVLPFPILRTVLEVNNKHPEDIIWTGSEFRRVTFT